MTHKSVRGVRLHPPSRVCLRCSCFWIYLLPQHVGRCVSSVCKTHPSDRVIDADDIVNERHLCTVCACVCVCQVGVGAYRVPVHMASDISSLVCDVLKAIQEGILPRLQPTRPTFIKQAVQGIHQVSLSKHTSTLHFHHDYGKSSGAVSAGALIYLVLIRGMFDIFE